MTDINEPETIAYFIHGLKKSQSAAKELAVENKSNAWKGIAKNLEQLLIQAQKLYEAKPLTRLQTLSMTNQMMPEVEDAGGKLPIIH